jgi:ABC-type transporter Mla subunit MlaD
MADRTPEQVNQSLDRLMEISAENTRNIAEMRQGIAELSNTVATVAGAVETLATLTDQRLNRQDQIIALLSSFITGIPPASDEPS